MIEVKRYDLPDYSIFGTEKNCYYFWIPDKKYLILGASNSAEESLITENVNADNIQVYKRPSGGQSVLLSPKTLVISALLTDQNFSSKEIFRKTNSLIIAGLKYFSTETFSLCGISDIAIGDKKILGSSMYHSKDKYFYHAVLNISESTDVISKYLKHPSKEPDYRRGRNHSDFITSLLEFGIKESAYEIKELLEKRFSEFFSLI